MTDPNAEATGAFDMDAAVDAIGLDLGFDGSAAEEDEDDAPSEDADDDAPAEDDGEADTAESEEADGESKPVAAKPATDPAAAAKPAGREPPKSWAKETHDRWTALAPEVQDYIYKREEQFHQGLEQYKGAAQFAKSIGDVIAPYRQVLQSQNLDETKAVASLMRAHVALTTGSPESRRAAFTQLAKNMGYTLPETGVQPMAPPTPHELELQQRLNRIESERAQQQAAEESRQRAALEAEVETFASDTANKYFNEVAHDMRGFVQAGMDLASAYKAAVWSNDVTRAKEIAALETQWSETAQKNARAKIDAARRGTLNNVRAVDSRRAPTEPKGKFLSDSAMRDDLAAIKSRTQ